MLGRNDLISETLGVLTIIGSFSVAWLLMDFHHFTTAAVDDTADAMIEYQVRPGDTLGKIAMDFQQRGWIRHALYMKLYARLHETGSIKAGEYLLDTSSSAVALLDKLVRGEAILHELTIIEGWTYRQMLAAIRGHEKIRQTLPPDIAGDALMNRLDKPGLHPEGQFLPDTYHFHAGISDLELLDMAHQALHKTLQHEWQQRAENLPLTSAYEALTLASIVEKETGVAEERPVIAGVFVTRLRKNMKLQTDPTVIYGIGENFDGNITRKHLREDTPYNTYVHRGLTPTPISLAGKDAIAAVMQPREEGYLFFVAMADGSGRHYFSHTLKEHNAAVRKYQLKK